MCKSMNFLVFLCCLAGVFTCRAQENFLEFPGGVRVLYWASRPLEAGSADAEYAVIFVHGLMARTKDLTPSLARLIRDDPRAARVLFVQPAFVTAKSCPPELLGKFSQRGICAITSTCISVSSATVSNHAACLSLIVWRASKVDS